MRKLALLAFTLMPHAACSQISSGTVVIINFTKDKLVLAADSRGVHRDRSRPPDDTQCKISTFGRKVLFANAGVLSYSRAVASDPADEWNNSIAAHEAFSMAESSNGSFEINIDTVTAYWAQSLVAHWKSLYLWHPEVVLEAAEQGVGVLTVGFFATANHGVIEKRFVLITFDRSKLIPIEAIQGPNLESCWPCGQPNGYTVCAMGHFTIPAFVCSDRSKGAMRWQGGKGETTTIKDSDIAKTTAIGLAEITAACDLTGYIAVPIDAVELRSDGSIYWLARKENCPEN